MKKYLSLQFSNSKIFRNEKPEDFINIKGIYRKRKENQKYFVEPITVHQISNLIHVLMGERPVPSLREVKYPEVYKKNERLFQIALDSYLKISSLTYKNDKGEEKPITETFQLRKMVKDSYSKNVSWSWERTRIYLEYEEYFEFFKKELSAYFKIKDITKISFGTVKEQLCKDVVSVNGFETHEDLIKSFENSFKDLKAPKGLERLFNVFYEKEPLFTKTDLLKEDVETENDVFLKSKSYLLHYMIFNVGEVNKFRRQNNPIATPRLVQFYKEDKVVVLSGEIIIPLEEDDIEKLKNSNCHATFLDGGLVKFKQLSSGYNINLDGFKKVSEISTETKEFIKKPKKEENEN